MTPRDATAATPTESRSVPARPRRPSAPAPTTLAALVRGLDAVLERGSLEVPVTALCCDDRDSVPGALFLAVPGVRADGSRFARSATERGATTVVLDARAPLPEGLAVGTTVLRTRDVRRLKADLAHRFHGHPGSELCCVGVTGTNGKTTTTRWLHSIFRAAGRRPVFLGTTGLLRADGSSVPGQHTTPDALPLVRFLAEERDRGADSAVLEVSSHALEQERVRGLPFAAAVFTQLSREHLDYHRDVESYLAAKARLFTGLAPSAHAVLNAEDRSSLEVARDTRAPLSTYGMVPGATCSAANVRASACETRFTWVGRYGSFPVQLALPGRYNVMNALAAGTCALALGLPIESVQEGLAALRRVEGRLEPIASARGFSVFVDYAHTDDALEKVLAVLRPLTKGRLIVVFGCGGDRDRSKRPRMGRVAELRADVVVLTSDNPRSEDPAAIAAEVLTGIGNPAAVELELDRRAAIESALRRAREGDVVLVAGKGHESGQIVGDRVLPFDDRQVVEELLCRT